MLGIYYPYPLKTFILCDPKTRKISKSEFRDRIVHHSICNIIEPIFFKSFIYDSCANQKGKGNLFGIRRFDLFKRKITKNNTKIAFCLKADIKHYFQEVNHKVLINILKQKIKDERVLLLIEKILKNYNNTEKGMPLGNLTSQFFANIYLHELDFFIKHKLKQKYYIRYVDDFVIFSNSKNKLENIKKVIKKFLQNTLRLELHPDKTKIILLNKGIDFLGFRNFYHNKLLRKRNTRKMFFKVNQFKTDEIPKSKILEIFNGWNAYAKWANTYNLRKKVVSMIYS